ncbi:hypothetical protein WJ542_21680 [Paraburkholderia sp. B3]|uniref:hypothetical protein n=1 Tax=Paraburkholderia sp. B3 TaxID=3134791 RepID=UPI003981AC74
MNAKKPSLDRRDTQDAALYPTRRAGRPRTETSTLHDTRGTFSAPLSLVRILHPYEYWAYATPDDSGDVGSAPPRAEPEPPKSGWPAAPPLAVAGWWRRWTARALFRSGAP